MDMLTSSSLDNLSNNKINNNITINTSHEFKSTQGSIHSPCSSDKSDNSEGNESNILLIDSSPDSPKKRNTIKDFDMTMVLGKGSYAKVVLARNIYTNKQYALKIIDKLFLGKVFIF
jgi:hypothetical protein